MFDQETANGSRFDVSADKLAKWIVSFAHFSKDKELEYRNIADAIRADGDPLAATAYSAEADRYMVRAMSTVAPLRNAIKDRTIAEDIAAKSRVTRDQARFLMPSCAAETCLDCERPLWHHIAVGSSTILCPFGREYWTIARAILADRYPGCPASSKTFLATIARRP